MNDVPEDRRYRPEDRIMQGVIPYLSLGGKAGAAAGKGPSTGKPGSGKGKAAAGEAAPKCSQAFIEGLRAAVQQYMDVWQEYEPSDPSAALREWHAELCCAELSWCL